LIAVLVVKATAIRGIRDVPGEQGVLAGPVCPNDAAAASLSKHADRSG
jgi:hypothetical protein